MARFDCCKFLKWFGILVGRALLLFVTFIGFGYWVIMLIPAGITIAPFLCCISSGKRGYYWGSIAGFYVFISLIASTGCLIYYAVQKELWVVYIMAAWVFLSMAVLIGFILAWKDKLDLIFPNGGWKNLKIHARKREWKTSSSTRQYVPTISEEVSNQLKTEIKTLKTDKLNLQKTIQSLEQKNQTTQDKNKTLTLELGESKTTVDAERKRVEELRAEVQKAKDEVQVITEKADKNETEKKQIIITRDILLEKIEDYQQKLEDHKDEIEKLKFDCPSCYDNFEGIDHGMVVSKNCGHILGEFCLRKELEKDAPRCPACNRRFNEADIMRVYKL